MAAGGIDGHVAGIRRSAAKARLSGRESGSIPPSRSRRAMNRSVRSIVMCFVSSLSREHPCLPADRGEASPESCPNDSPGGKPAPGLANGRSRACERIQGGVTHDLLAILETAAARTVSQLFIRQPLRIAQRLKEYAKRSIERCPVPCPGTEAPGQ